MRSQKPQKLKVQSLEYFFTKKERENYGVTFFLFNDRNVCALIFV